MKGIKILFLLFKKYKYSNHVASLPVSFLRWRGHGGGGRSLRHLQRGPAGFLRGGAGPDGGGRSQPAGQHGEAPGGRRRHRRPYAGAEVNCLTVTPPPLSRPRPIHSPSSPGPAPSL